VDGELRYMKLLEKLLVYPKTSYGGFNISKISKKNETLPAWFTNSLKLELEQMLLLHS
jgi:hypothetical protein